MFFVMDSPRLVIEKAKPAYRLLSDELSAILASGKFQLGERFYSVREVADSCNVSRITAHLAIKELVKQGFLKQEKHRAALVARLPERDSRSSSFPQQGGDVRHDSDVITNLGLVLSQWDTQKDLAWDDRRILPFLLKEAESRGISIQIIPHTLASGDLQIFDRYVEQQRIKGLLWFSMRDNAIVSASRWAGRNFVQVAIQGRPANLDIALVSENNELAGEQTARLVAREGHEKVLVLYLDSTINTYVERLSGYKKGMKLGGVNPDSTHIIPLPSNYRFADGGEWMEPLLRKYTPNALVILSPILMPVYNGIKKCGYPLDSLSIIAFPPPESFEYQNWIPPFQYRFWRPAFQEIGSGVINTWLKAFTQAASGNDSWRQEHLRVPMEMFTHIPQIELAAVPFSMPSFKT